MKKLTAFTLPLMAAHALQIGFNLVDMFFMGRYAGTDALSAVSIGGQITMLMLAIFTGVAVGSQIYIAQVVGSGRRDMLGKIVGNTLMIGLVVGLLLMLVIPLARPILRLVRTPEEILDISVEYLVIYTAGVILTSVYNAVCGILRGMGDSSWPTLFVAVATVINIGLDYLFVARFHWGAAGAAWATVIGQAAACVFALIFLYARRSRLGFALEIGCLAPDKRHIGELLRLGIPVAAKTMFICLTLVIVNAQINHLGVTAIAITGICSKVQSVINVVAQAMAESTASMVGQNAGAGKLDRIRRTLIDSTLISLIFAAVLTAAFLLFPRQIFGIFSSDPAVLEQAPRFMKVCAFVVVSSALMNPAQGLINGVGDTMFNMLVAFGDGVVARLTLSMLFGYGLEMGAFGFFLGNCLSSLVSVTGGGWYYLSGRWRPRAARISREWEAEQ